MNNDLLAIASGISHELCKLSRDIIFTTIDCEFSQQYHIRWSMLGGEEYGLPETGIYILGFKPSDGKHEPIDLIKLTVADSIIAEIPLDNFHVSIFGVYEYADPKLMDKLVKDVRVIIKKFDFLFPNGDCGEP